MAVKETAENCRKKGKTWFNKVKKSSETEVQSQRPDAVWCTDITYIWTSEGFMYLSTIMDLFSHNIIAWELSRTMEEEFVIKTVEKADAYIKSTEKMKRSYSKVHYPLRQRKPLQSGFILTVVLLHQTNMKFSFRTRILLCDIKRQLKSQFRLGYLLTEEQLFFKNWVWFCNF